MIEAALLEDRAVLALCGVEARDFLQGLITNDVTQCKDSCGIYTALLTPQGKILFDFFVIPEGDNRLLIDCAADRAGDLMKRLTLYRLRAKVDIAARPELAVAALWGDVLPGDVPHGVITIADPRRDALGLRMIGARDVLVRAMAGFARGDHRARRLSLGVPDSADLPSDSVFALDAGLEELNGVSFKKGCYIGQEVTSRMKHRATARRRFLMAETIGAIPPPGTPLEAQGRELGVLATGEADRALALVRLDRLADAEEKHAPITAAGQPVILKKPDWFHV